MLQNYAHDIAILKLETPIRFSMYVAPVCMDWDVSAYEVADGDMGKVRKLLLFLFVYNIFSSF